MAKYILVLLIFSLCVSTAQSTGSTSLLEALEFVTTDTDYISFTNWEQLKTYEGLANLSSQNSLEERRAFYQSLLEAQAAASAHGVSSILAFDHAEMWGWDTLDLRWEITLQVDGPPVYVLALQKDFDTTRLENLLVNRNYQKTTVEDVDLYSHKLEFADWVLGELSILNIAILRNKNMLVLSSAPESVQAVLTADGHEPSLKQDLYRRALNPLGDVASAILTLGTWCSELSFEGIKQTFLEQGMSEEAIDKIQEQIGSSPFHPYVSFALGYRYEDDQPLGVVVMDYADAPTAQADLEARRMEAEEGLSLRVNLPYRAAVFEVQEARVEDTVLVLELLPFNSQPKRLFEMVYTRDMSFAACP